MPATRSAVLEEDVQDTLLVEDPSLSHGFVQLPKLVLYARNLSRDAKLLYAVLLGYAWQEKRCFPGYQRLCEDLDASENMARKYMRELESVHLVSQRRRGQGRTNVYILHDLRTAEIEVQDQHKIAVVKPQESEDNEEAVQKQTQKEQSGIRDSKASRLQTEIPVHEALFTHSAVFSTAKDRVLKSLAGQQTRAFTSKQQTPTPPQRKGKSDPTKSRGEKETTKAHPSASKREKAPDWLPGYIVDFSREFHDEKATPSNVTRAAHLYERAGIDAEAFITQLYEARKIIKGRANIQSPTGCATSVPNRTFPQ